MRLGRCRLGLYSRPERLRQIAERFGIDAEAVLENVIFTRCYNSDAQMDLLAVLAAKFHEEGGAYRVLVGGAPCDSWGRGLGSQPGPTGTGRCARRLGGGRQIINSIIALFRVDYSGRGELAERQQKLNQMLGRLIKFADEYNVAIVITNQYAVGQAHGKGRPTAMT